MKNNTTEQVKTKSLILERKTITKQFEENFVTGIGGLWARPVAPALGESGTEGPVGYHSP